MVQVPMWLLAGFESHHVGSNYPISEAVFHKHWLCYELSNNLSIKVMTVYVIRQDPIEPAGHKSDSAFIRFLICRI